MCFEKYLFLIYCFTSQQNIFLIYFFFGVNILIGTCCVYFFYVFNKIFLCSVIISFCLTINYHLLLIYLQNISFKDHTCVLKVSLDYNNQQMPAPTPSQCLFVQYSEDDLWSAVRLELVRLYAQSHV